MIILKSERELELMREPGNIVGKTLGILKNEIAPGITTKHLDEIVEKFIRDKGAVPAFKGYNGFPASVCSSVNEQVVHGIPGLRKLNSGDIISIDVGAVKNGYCGDAAITVAVGKVEPEVEDLIRVTQEALFKGIEKAVVGNRLSDISHAVQTHAEKNGLSVVRDYVGHGIGKNMHEDPQIPNFGSPGKGPRLSAGMVLAIEPMLNLGTYEVETLEDNWTVVTKDRKYSAHFEHTVAITDEGPQIFTEH